MPPDIILCTVDLCSIYTASSVAQTGCEVTLHVGMSTRSEYFFVGLGRCRRAAVWPQDEIEQGDHICVISFCAEATHTCGKAFLYDQKVKAAAQFTVDEQLARRGNNCEATLQAENKPSKDWGWSVLTVLFVLPSPVHFTVRGGFKSSIYVHFWS